ncbi:MAG: hypothetical protein IJR49_02645 [Treponema sp.]|nr:hypothetical protein [Treponema sp.]
MKKKCIAFFAFVFLCININAQESINQTQGKEQNELQEKPSAAEESAVLERESKSESSSHVFGEPFVRPMSAKEFFSQVDFFLTISPGFIINTEKNPYGLRANVVVPISIGFTWPNYTLVSMQPRISFFWNYYAWNNDMNMAFPTQSEHRLATSLAFFLTIPASITFRPKAQHSLEMNLGLSVLIRIAFLAKNVSASDLAESGTAADDLKNIRKWQWGKVRCLYLSTGFLYLYKISERFQVGPELYLHIPFNAIFFKSERESFIISAGLKMAF